MKKNYKKLAMFNSGLELYFYSKWLNFTRNASLSWNRPEFGIAWGSLALVCPLVQNILAIPKKWNEIQNIVLMSAFDHRLESVTKNFQYNLSILVFRIDFDSRLCFFIWKF